MRVTVFAAVVLAAGGGAAPAADFPKPDEGDAVLKDFKFASGESLPGVRIHYRTLGRPARGPDGRVANAVLVLHGTGGSGRNFVEGRRRAVLHLRHLRGAVRRARRPPDACPVCLGPRVVTAGGRDPRMIGG